MPRNMSFFITTKQFKDRSKTVTRRVGWWDLRPGDVLCGVEKGQGLKKGEKINRLGMIEVVNVTAEPLGNITQSDCVKEGFPNLTPEQFIAMFIRSHKGTNRNTIINRIEYKYLPEA